MSHIHDPLLDPPGKYLETLSEWTDSKKMRTGFSRFSFSYVPCQVLVARAAHPRFTVASPRLLFSAFEPSGTDYVRASREDKGYIISDVVGIVRSFVKATVRYATERSDSLGRLTLEKSTATLLRRGARSFFYRTGHATLPFRKFRPESRFPSRTSARALLRQGLFHPRSSRRERFSLLSEKRTLPRFRSIPSFF